MSFNHVIDLTTMVTFSELSNKNPLALILWGHLKFNEKEKKCTILILINSAFISFLVNRHA